LQRVGAVAIKNSVYVLPRSDQTLETSSGFCERSRKAEATRRCARRGFVEGLSDGQIEALFRVARDADYASIADEARELGKKHRPHRTDDEDTRSKLDTEAARLRKRLAEVTAIDFFDSLGRQTAEGLVSAWRMNCDRRPVLKKRSRAKAWRSIASGVGSLARAIHIDRMGSAWLIKRFIDPDARFKFVPARGYRPEKREIRFDMFDAEFTHEGDRCTSRFLSIAWCQCRSVAGDRGNHSRHRSEGQQFERTEAAGIDALITGICMHYKDDDERLQRGSAVFDDLFESFSRRTR